MFINTEDSSKYWLKLSLAAVLSDNERIHEQQSKITAATQHTEVGLKMKIDYFS